MTIYLRVNSQFKKRKDKKPKKDDKKKDFPNTDEVEEEKVQLFFLLFQVKLTHFISQKED